MTQSTSPSRHGATAIARTEEPTFLERPNGVRQRDGKRAAAHLDVGDPSPGERGAHRSDLAVQRAEHDRHPVERLRELAVLLTAPESDLPRRVRKRHHVRPFLGPEPEPARQVRVEDVEPARPELEQPRLLVDEHLVADLDLAGQPRVGDARDPVHLEPDQTVLPLADRGDRPASKADLSGGIDQRQRHVDHRVQIVDGDVLLGGVDLRHPVREIEAGQTLAC